MEYSRGAMDFSGADDRAYFMVGNLVSNGKVVGERFIGLPCFAEKICLGGDLPETVDAKLDDMDDFIENYITYGVFGNKELNVISFDGGSVIEESRNRLLQLDLHEYPHNIEGERIVYEIHYIDTVGSYQSVKLKSLDDVLDRLKQLDAVLFKSFSASEKFFPYLAFNRKGYMSEVATGQTIGGDCSAVSPYMEKETGEIKLFSHGFPINSTNGVCRFSKYISKARVEDDDARVSDVRVLDFSQCSRLSSLVYNHLIDEQKSYSEDMSIVFPSFADDSGWRLYADEFNISARKFKFANLPESVLFKRLSVLGGVNIVGADGYFIVENACIGDGNGTVTGLKKLHVGIPLGMSVGKDASLHIIDTDSEEITIALSNVVFTEDDRKYFEITNCKRLRKLTVICNFCLDLGVVMRGITGCDALSEIMIHAKTFCGVYVSKANRKRFGFADKIGYKNLKRLEINNFGLAELDRQFKVFVPYSCSVVCNNEKIASHILKERE